MGYNLWFGKYKGTSLEEVALGKACPGGGGKAEGYYYFNQLAKGDLKYFGMFQRSSSAMEKWKYIHQKLNQFKSPTSCGVCGKNSPTRISIAGSGQYGYSISSSYVTCDDKNCQIAMASMPSSGTGFYPLGFDTILQFGWASRNTKYDEKRLTEVLRELAGWSKGQRINDKTATEFIDRITLR